MGFEAAEAMVGAASTATARPKTTAMAMVFMMVVALVAGMIRCVVACGYVL